MIVGQAFRDPQRELTVTDIDRLSRLAGHASIDPT